LERAVREEWGIGPLYIREVPLPHPSLPEGSILVWNVEADVFRGGRYRELGGWKGSLMRVRLIFLWDRLVIMRI
jgi:hypothetical protein